MSQDDPFDPGQTSRTIIRPKPGRRNRSASKPASSDPNKTLVPPPITTFELPTLGDNISINAIASAALNLLTLSSLLRQSNNHANPETLFSEIIDEINQFNKKALDSGCDRDDVLVARYLLCTFIDENVMSTPWGCESIWTSRSTLSHFYKEGWGGEKFFEILERLQQTPREKVDLLEFIYLLLILGFQGRYRVQDSGQRELDKISQDLFRTIRQVRGDHERALSVNWKGVEKKESPLNRYLPVWAAGVVALIILLITYMGLLFSLHNNSDPVAGAIASLGNKFPEYERPTYRPPVRTKKLSTLLAAEIQADQLAVKNINTREVVVLSGDKFFASGKATIKEDSEALVARVAEALLEVPGKIVISGHSDNIPIRSLRFPSNWVLSKARAASVGEIIAGSIGVDRIMEIKGEADTRPVVSNDSRDNRALNRRVEIMLIQ